MSGWKRWRVFVRSAPGMWETYEGHVDVWARPGEDAFAAAVSRLARTSFRDRPALDSWRLVRIEPLPDPGQRLLI